MGPFLLEVNILSFIISKLFTYTFLSPAIFIILILFAIVFLLRDKKGWAILFLVFLAFLFYFFSIEPGSDLLLSPLEDHYPPLDLSQIEGKVDAIVILGGGVIEGHSPFRGSLSLTDSALSRVIYGYFVWKKLMVPIIVSGGRPLMKLPGTEAEVMKSYLLNLGVPEGFIIPEPRSNNTWENTEYVTKICKDSDFKSIVLVTSAFHMVRAMYAFSGRGLVIYPAPASYLTKRRPYIWTSFLPQGKYLYYSFLAIKERMGLLFYKIFLKKS